MTCYFRHLKQVFEKADIEVTPENKKDIDKTIHRIVRVNYKNCPNTWRQVKTHHRRRKQLYYKAERRVGKPQKIVSLKN